MGALEEAHLATAISACECECYEEEEDDDLVEGGGEDGEAAAAAADAMEPAVRALLLGLGEDERREGLRRTPKRVAKAFRDGTRATGRQTDFGASMMTKVCSRIVQRELGCGWFTMRITPGIPVMITMAVLYLLVYFCPMGCNSRKY